MLSLPVSSQPRVRRTPGFSSRLARYSAGTLTLAGSASLAHADFSGTYTLLPPAAGSYTLTLANQTFGTWTTSNVFNYGSTNTTTLNDADSPASVSLTASAPGQTEFTLLDTAPVAGTLSFSFTFSSSSRYGSAGYVVGTTDVDFSTSSGTVTNVALSAGQSFGFFVDGYEGTTAVTISSFSAPVPEPAAAGWIAAGAAGLLATRALRRRAASRATLPA